LGLLWYQRSPTLKPLFKGCPVLPTNDAFANAFQLLASIVRDFYSNNRPCLGATLKPALRSRGNFNEQILGFRKFSDFLRSAEAAGYV